MGAEVCSLYHEFTILRFVISRFEFATQCMHSISLNFNLAGKDPHTHTQMPNFFEVKKCSLQMKCKKKYPKIYQQFL